jgi:hypothetical protein
MPPKANRLARLHFYSALLYSTRLPISAKGEAHVSTIKFTDQIASLLKKAGFELEREPAIGGLRPDFLVSGPKGQTVVIEAKDWQSGGGNTARAMEQAKYYQAATGANNAVLVISDLKRNYSSGGVVNVNGLVPHLEELFSSERPRKAETERQSSDETIFAAMPFAGKYDDTFFIAMIEAAKSNNVSCIRVDHTQYSGDVVKEIRRRISRSVAVIADISEARPNVLFEAGYAEARSKPVIYICSTPMTDVPFDVRNELIKACCARSRKSG